MRGIVPVIMLMAACLSGCATPGDDVSAIPQSQPAPGSRDVRAPSGYIAFCERNPGDCAVQKGATALLAVTPDSWAKLETVNAAVNISILPEDDSRHYGQSEFWTVPIDGHGDCEDYVLAKRKMLLMLGLPEPALRIAVVLNEQRVRHAVLTVVTDKGDFVLDNARDEILPTNRIDYVWLSRQDPASRTGWTALDQDRSMAWVFRSASAQ
jgi:predicted transglutaminase-like cysteine proteinase